MNMELGAYFMIINILWVSHWCLIVDCTQHAVQYINYFLPLLHFGSRQELDINLLKIEEKKNDRYLLSL